MFLKMIATDRPPRGARRMRPSLSRPTRTFLPAVFEPSPPSDPKHRSTLLQAPPPGIAEILRDRGVHPQTLLLCTDTDIDTAGSYRTQWLVVTADLLLVCCDDRTPPV